MSSLRPPVAGTMQPPVSSLNRHAPTESRAPGGSSGQPNIVIPKIPTSTPIEMTGPNGVANLLHDLTHGTNADLTEMQLSDVEGTGSLSDLGSNIRSVSFQNRRTTKPTSSKSKINLKLT